MLKPLGAAVTVAVASLFLRSKIPVMEASKAANIIVVGGGLAGLSATIEAYRNGAKVTLLEKERAIGGNSAKATSGINGCLTKAQKLQNIPDTLEAFRADTIKSAGKSGDRVLMEILTELSTDAISWMESFGLSMNVLSKCGGHSLARTHREPPKPDGRPSPVGWEIIASLKKYVSNVIDGKDPQNTGGSIKIVTESKVVELITDADKTQVFGVKYQSSGDKEVKEMRGDAVIITTGGFACDYNTPDSLLKQYANQYINVATTNGNFAEGDGVKLGRSIGASLVDMEKVQIHPTGFVDPKDPNNKVKFLAPEALRGHGGILVSSVTGKRFIDELQTRAVVSQAIFQHCRAKPDDLAVCFLILNEEGAKDFGFPNLNFYKGKGLIEIVENGVEGLAAHTNLPLETLKDTLTKFNEGAKKGKDEFGKVTFPITFNLQERFYVARITPVIHYTMGGLRINTCTEVLRDKPYTSREGALEVSGIPILGLYAAGEASGGVHGDNRLAGNSLLECVVFGRRAGERASTILRKDVVLTSDKFSPLQLRFRTRIGNSLILLRFNLPSSRACTGLGVGEYIALRANVEGKEIIRYYSPYSRPDELGLIDFLVKLDDNGVMSKLMMQLRPGDYLDFKGPLGGFKLDFTDKDSKLKKIGLVAGGSGISPMLQIIRSVLYHHRNDVEVRLLYGAMTEEDLVFKDTLDSICNSNPNVKVHYMLNKPSANWTGGVGFITDSTLREHLPPPAEDVFLVLCGPFNMCKVMKELFEKCGYTKEMYHSYM